MGVKGGVVGSIKKLRSAVKKGSGAGYLARPKQDEDNMYRFMTEPDEWFAFSEHYDAVRKYYPCADDCPGCAEGDRPTPKWLANAVDLNAKAVVPLVLGKTLAGMMTKYYEKYATITDRDYSIDRSGTGKDTEYLASPEAPSRMRMSQYEPLDLETVLEAQLVEAEDDDDDDTDDEPVRASRRSGSSSRVSPKRRRPVDDDDDDDDEEDDEPVQSRRKPAPAARKPLAKPGAARRAKEAAARDAQPARKPLRKPAPAAARKPIRRAR